MYEYLFLFGFPVAVFLLTYLVECIRYSTFKLDKDDIKYCFLIFFIVLFVTSFLTFIATIHTGKRISYFALLICVAYVIKLSFYITGLKEQISDLKREKETLKEILENRDSIIKLQELKIKKIDSYESKIDELSTLLYKQEKQIEELENIKLPDAEMSRFQKGYEKGHFDGYKEGIDDGFKDGYKEGYTIGNRDGIDEGKFIVSNSYLN